MYYNLIIWKILKDPFKSEIYVNLIWFKLLKHDVIKSSKCIILRDVHVIIFFLIHDIFCIKFVDEKWKNILLCKEV